MRGYQYTSDEKKREIAAYILANPAVPGRNIAEHFGVNINAIYAAASSHGISKVALKKDLVLKAVQSGMFRTQQEIANATGMSRTAVEANLQRMGLGKGKFSTTYLDCPDEPKKETSDSERIIDAVCLDILKGGRIVRALKLALKEAK